MKKLQNWFIGDYLAKTDNVFEQVKIRLVYNFAIFFIVQALLLYTNTIISHHWHRFTLISMAWGLIIYMLYVLKVKQNARLASLIWLIQSSIVGTFDMVVQGVKLDMMAGMWVMVELLFTYFTLGGVWAVVSTIHVLLEIALAIINVVVYHNTLFDIGSLQAERLPENPIFIIIPFSLCLYILSQFIRMRSEAEKVLHNQKIQLEEKNKEITDSINYANHIQSAILPSQEFITKQLSESFIIYQPKSIVSGDFYWVVEKDNLVYFAVCDCTGHGVPGAMMSVIAQNILNRTVFAFNCKTPAKILDTAAELMEQALNQGGKGIRDGMDIALCIWNKTTNTLEYAGANNPLYLISENKLKEFKADKQPIGKYENKRAFTNNSIPVKNGDVIYLFSDGMADQFGGSTGKKFKYKALRELLLKVHQQSKEQQKNIILSAFNTWKGNYEQVDDVCIMGVKL